MPERWGDLHRVHDAGISRQVHAIYEPAARIAAVISCGTDLRAGDSCLAAIHTGIVEQGTELAEASE
jgi:hypothetical protein